MTIIPFMLHSLSMSMFSSVIGPFGGFFASGFKRAFKIKVYFITLFYRKIILTILKLGFWRHHSRSWWYHGPFRLPVPHGYIRQRLHFPFIRYDTPPKLLEQVKNKKKILFYHQNYIV